MYICMYDVCMRNHPDREGLCAIIGAAETDGKEVQGFGGA